jgi:hypothetical protein
MIDWTATRVVTVMPRKRYTPEEIIQHRRMIELDTGKGSAVPDACRKLGITEQMRAQFLNGELFYTLKEAQIMTERWRNRTTRSVHTAVSVDSHLSQKRSSL